MITIALIGWPLLMLVFVKVMPWPNAIIVSLIGGFLLLPERGGLDLPMLPALEKDTIPCLVLLFIALILRPGQQAGYAGQQDTTLAMTGWLPRSATGQILLFLIAVAAFGTALTNGDRIRFAETSFSIPGLSLYDAFSIIVRSASLIVPVLLGRKYLADSSSHRLILIALVVAGLGYSLLALVEVRLSPQMNRWVYGFFPHSWQQHIRAGGFRPLVFLSHGLVLASFFSMTIIAALGLAKSETRSKTLWFFAAMWLLATLVLSNSLGALLIALALAPVIYFLGVRMQLLFVAAIAVIVLSYPLLRGADLVPTQKIVAAAIEHDVGRGFSLRFRFENEDQLIERANERPLFGWGSFGRNRIYDEFGRDQSVVDGAWVVTIGQGGWVRYLGEFGLLSIPLILFAIRRKRYDVSAATAALCLVLAANMIDLLPNASRTPLTWLIVGALLGRLELGREKVSSASSDQVVEADPRFAMAQEPVSAYTRQKILHRRNGSSRNS